MADDDLVVVVWRDGEGRTHRVYGAFAHVQEEVARQAGVFVISPDPFDELIAPEVAPEPPDAAKEEF